MSSVPIDLDHDHPIKMSRKRKAPAPTVDESQQCEPMSVKDYQTSIDAITAQIEQLEQKKRALFRECQAHHQLCANCLHNHILKEIYGGTNCWSCIEDMRDPPW